jgi:hypothetical protein
MILQMVSYNSVKSYSALTFHGIPCFLYLYAVCTARSPNLGRVPKPWTTAVFEEHFYSNECNSKRIAPRDLKPTDPES